MPFDLARCLMAAHLFKRVMPLEFPDGKHLQSSGVLAIGQMREIITSRIQELKGTRIFCKPLLSLGVN